MVIDEGSVLREKIVKTYDNYFLYLRSGYRKSYDDMLKLAYHDMQICQSGLDHESK